MPTVEALLPVSEIPIIKQAVRELDLDMTTGEVVDGLMTCYFLVPDYGSLIAIGFIAAANKCYKSFSGPMDEFIDKMQAKADELNKKKNDEQE